MPSYINKCFWTYPTASDVPAGQVMDFSVVIPPPEIVPGTNLGTTVPVTVFPVTGSSISWSLQDAAGKEMVNGVDYTVVDGGLTSERLAVVFTPPTADEKVKVCPTLSLFYLSETTKQTVVEPSDFTAQTFTLKAQAVAVDDIFFNQCFWTYPALDNVPAGRTLDFRVIIPPPAAPAPGVPGFPLAGASVAWSITDGASPPKELTPGVHYQITQGGLGSELLSVVFNPVDGKNVSVSPELTLFYANSANPVTGTLPANSYVLDGVTTDAWDKVKSQLAKAIALVTDNVIIEPGEPATLRIVPTDVLDIPQVVTSLLHETPKVKIRGAIPLDSLVEAFLQPVRGVLGQFVPGGRPSLDEAELEVRKLLGGLFSIPLAFDVQGDRLTKTLAPAGAPEIPLLSFSPDGRTLSGVIPIGSWPATFNLDTVSWVVEEPDAPGSNTWKKVVPNDLSPGVSLSKSFLLRPDIVPMSVSAGATKPTPVRVTATLTIKINASADTEGAASKSTITIVLPSVTLQRLPLPLPQIAAVFTNDFYNLTATDQRVFLTTDKQTAPFLASQSDCINYIARLTGVLNKIASVGTSLGDKDWQDLLGLATGLGYLSDQLGRIDPGKVFFQPCLQDNWRCINLSASVFNNSISAVISVGVPSANGFVLSDSDGNTYITCGRTTYYSILPDLNLGCDPIKDRGCDFGKLQQIPPGCANTNNPVKVYYNDRLEVLGYGNPP